MLFFSDLKVGQKLVALSNYDINNSYTYNANAYAIATIVKIDNEKMWIYTDLGKYKIDKSFLANSLKPTSPKSIKHLSKGQFVDCYGYSGFTPDKLCVIDERNQKLIKEIDQRAKERQQRQEAYENKKANDDIYLSAYKEELKPLEDEFFKMKAELYFKHLCCNCTNYENCKNNKDYFGTITMCSSFNGKPKN